MYKLQFLIKVKENNVITKYFRLKNIRISQAEQNSNRIV